MAQYRNVLSWLEKEYINPVLRITKKVVSEAEEKSPENGKLSAFGAFVFIYLFRLFPYFHTITGYAVVYSEESGNKVDAHHRAVIYYKRCDCCCGTV